MKFRARSLPSVCLWCLSSLLASAALAGSLVGTVFGPGGQLLSGIQMNCRGTDGTQVTALTDASGQYAFNGLSAGSYWLSATFDPSTPSAIYGQLYSEIPCTAGCNLEKGSEIAVGAASPVTIDFHLQEGETISGNVTAAGTGVPLAVYVYATEKYSQGSGFGSAFSNGPGGAYTIVGLPPGDYYLLTYSFGQAADQLYPNLPCGPGCDVTAGATVAAGNQHADFALAAAGAVSGFITDPGGNPISTVAVTAWQGTTRLGFYYTDTNGKYTIGGLPLASGYRILATKPGFVPEVYSTTPHAYCPGGQCDLSSTGTGVDVVNAGTTITGKSIQLAVGHSIKGNLVPSGTRAQVQALFTAPFDRVAGAVDAIGTYTIADLPDGTYKVRASMSTYVAERYPNQPCPGATCGPAVGSPIAVAGSDVSGIDFTLDPGGVIRGRVRDAATGDPISDLEIDVLRADGVPISQSLSGSNGSYSNPTEALPPGNYKVRSRQKPWDTSHVDVAWPDDRCDPLCGGDTIVVDGPGDISDIDLSLPVGGLQFYTVPPCRVFDSRSGPALTSGAEIPLRLETFCGIPGNAVSTSLNITVLSATGPGSLSLWPINLPEPPLNAAITFTGPQARANNAIIPMSLLGLQNVYVRGLVAGAGTYHLVIDVNGYFAQ